MPDSVLKTRLVVRNRSTCQLRIPNKIARTPIQSIHFLLHSIHLLIILNQLNMEIDLKKGVEDKLEQDIFETVIGVESAQEKEKRFKQAWRNSMMARGGAEDHLQSEKIIFAVGREIKKISYEEATQLKYGFQGVLLKESPNLFGGWDERYCILKGQRFVYKENQYPTSPNAGVLNFNLLSCDLHGEKQGNLYQHFMLTVINAEKKFIFKGQTKEETTEWAKKLREAIFDSEGYGKNLSYLAHYPRFWRKDYESQSEFRRTVETGDVLLFRGKKNSSMMQRALTRDEFDHVAVAILNSKGEALLFEANGGFGVGICPWSRFISRKWHEQYDLVVHRHLNVKRSQEFSREVDDFISKNMGKKYDFSLKEYLFNRNSSGQEDREVFFCSSLVAKLYKKLQLLDPNKSCTQYLPSWFANGGGNLRGDGKNGYAFFDDQKIIVFQQR